jgi:hydrogenase expression/formation protein HypC
MCLAVPAKILWVEGPKGKVDFGDGVRRDIDLTLVNAKTGDYVLVHAGFAIQILSEEDAKKTLEIWEEILKD